MKTKKCGIVPASQKRPTTLNKRKIAMLEKLTIYFMILFPFTFILSILLAAYLFSGGYVSGKLGILGVFTIINAIPLGVLGILKAMATKLLEDT